MKGARLLILVPVLLALISLPTSAAPQAGPCTPGMIYDPACDVNHDGQITITDIQLTAGHWNQSGAWTGDNDHDHLGQTWMGTNNPLKLVGSYGEPDYVPLVLSNSYAYGDGLRVNEAGANGVSIGSAGNDGVYVGSAGSYGVQVNSAVSDGVHVGWTSNDGVSVGSAGNDGVHVGSVAGDGVQVDSAGGDGVYVGSAGNHGVYVDSASGDGLVVDSAGYSGVYVYSAGTDGVHVYSADNYGVSVYSAGLHGVYVNSAGADGMYVESAGYSGVYLDTVGHDGFFVRYAGAPSTSVYSSANNGFEVAGAQGNGLYVGRADIDGVVIRSAGDDGIQLGEDGISLPYGLYVSHPGTIYTTLLPNTANVNGEWALHTADKILAANVTMDAQTLLAVVGGDQPLAAGDVVTAVGLADPIPGSHERLALVGLAGGETANVVGVVSSRMALQPLPGKDGQEELHSLAGPAQPGDYVAITVLGVAQVKVQDGEAIQPGQRLTVAATPGHARALQSKIIEGMMVTEGASVIGAALEAPRDGLVWVLVNPQ